jgi:hypothetical protein
MSLRVCFDVGCVNRIIIRENIFVLLHLYFAALMSKMIADASKLWVTSCC